MNQRSSPSRRDVLAAALSILASTGSGMADAQDRSQQSKVPIRTADPKIEAGSASIDGRPLPYRRAGTGPAVLLLHAASATSDAKWNDLLHRLGKRYTTVSVSTGDLAAAAGTPAGEGSASGMAKAVVALARSLQLERPFLVGSGAGAVVAYAVGRSEPAAVRGLMLLDTLVPGIAPWKAEGAGAAWTVEASLNASHNVPNETPLVMALGQKSPHAAQIANHAVALRAHGWSRIDTALVRMAGSDLVVDQVGPVGTLVEKHAR
jgi:pimeloyl-ACP methyl ester carboxylesterase